MFSNQQFCFCIRKNGVNSLPKFSYPGEYWMASLSISVRLRIHRTSYYRMCSRQDMICLFLHRLWFNNSNNYSQNSMPLNKYAILRLIIKNVDIRSVEFEPCKEALFNVQRYNYCRWYSHNLHICGHLILGHYTYNKIQNKVTPTIKLFKT